MANALLSVEPVSNALEGLNDQDLLDMVLCRHVHEARLQEAAQMVNDWQQRSPGSAAVAGARAWVDWHQGQPEAAAECARSAVGRGASSALAHGVLAMNALRTGQWDDALLHAQHASRESTAHPYLSLLLAETHFKRAELPAGELALRRAAQQDRGDCSGRLALAEHLLSGETTPSGVQEALGLATAVLRSHPHEATAWAIAGLGHAAAGSWSQGLPYPIYIPELLPFYMQLKELPLDFVVPEEGRPFANFDLSVLKNAPNPNAARLFINHMLETPAQLVYANAGFTPVIQGVVEQVDPQVRPFLQTRMMGTTRIDQQEAMLALATEIYK